jgi:hypothetical protein
MTKEEALQMSSEKVFLHMEARLAKALEETEKKYGKDMATICEWHNQINGTIRALIEDASELPCPVHIALCAWIETIARWNQQIDEWITK